MLCLSLLIVVMANTALIVAAPDMTRDLGLTSTQLQWVIDGYTVPYAALMLLFGVIGDKYSRRGALLAGLAVFAGGAVFGSIADTTNAVIAARMIMGVGAAIIMPATLSLLVATFPKAERSRAIAAWAATSGLAIALGPLLAGWILDSHSWSITFLINVPIAAVAAVAAVILVPPSKAEHLAGSTGSAAHSRWSPLARSCTRSSTDSTSGGPADPSVPPYSLRSASSRSSSGNCVTRSHCSTSVSSASAWSAARRSPYFCCSWPPSAPSTSSHSSSSSSSATAHSKPVFVCCPWQLPFRSAPLSVGGSLR